jgi:hypothetical protein
MLGNLLHAALSCENGMRWMRAECGFAPADEAALCRLAQRFPHQSDHDAAAQRNAAEFAKAQARADADVARHGLRTCTLPECGKQEPHPKLFKLCGRCRGAAYCCVEHRLTDWRRHKHDGCCEAAP